MEQTREERRKEHQEKIKENKKEIEYLTREAEKLKEGLSDEGQPYLLQL